MVSMRCQRGHYGGPRRDAATPQNVLNSGASKEGVNKVMAEPPKLLVTGTLMVEYQNGRKTSWGLDL